MTVRPTSLCLMLCTAWLLSACSSHKTLKCDESPGSYLKAQEQAALQVPEPLATPGKSASALVIPAARATTKAGTACLERPPAYFGISGRLAASPEETVADWAQAWADRNSNAVMAMYSSQFKTDAPEGSAAMLEQRLQDIIKGPLPNARVRQLSVTSTGDDERLARFVQTFGDTNRTKELTLIREAGVWKIARESLVSSAPVKPK